eukprot:TRINITY_DN16268_c0_g3_i1.p1 TRINITY_DN16268_c0_g3~~TRINITY_DN16268_c0_g3_i1.p1  ORF type:complete len:175 (-),score=29.09 TRINITY_DN16268_c0_g3_i1:32-556(-)
MCKFLCSGAAQAWWGGRPSETMAGQHLRVNAMKDSRTHTSEAVSRGVANIPSTNLKSDLPQADKTCIADIVRTFYDETARHGRLRTTPMNAAHLRPSALQQNNMAFLAQLETYCQSKDRSQSTLTTVFGEDFSSTDLDAFSRRSSALPASQSQTSTTDAAVDGVSIAPRKIVSL